MNDIILAFQQIDTGSYHFPGDRRLFRYVWDSRWCSLSGDMDHFMRTGAQSRNMKHCTVSNCCVVIYIFRHDQLFPTLVALSVGGGFFLLELQITVRYKRLLYPVTFFII